MASTAKYQQAPQVDPDDHDDYTQAPPSYQAQASSSSDEERLLSGATGEPRNSSDEVPDDFKVCRETAND